MHRVLLTLALVAAPIAPIQAQQAETLADIRQELTVLFVEVQGLKRELSTTGSPSAQNLPASVLDRVAVMERALQELTSRTEELTFRVDRIVQDGTNRIGDLEFRLCELETTCDLGNLGQTTTLGGGTAPPRPTPAAPSGGAQLAVGERADFDRAQAALSAGNYEQAAQLFANFSETYPGGPLTAEANFLRGEALTQLGTHAPAARAYLTAFSSDPTGSRAPDALLRLGGSLGDLGQTDEACVTLGEIAVRFPGSGAVADAAQLRQTLGCG